LSAVAESKLAPKVLITKNWGCGNYECCNFTFPWAVIKAADVFNNPGNGQKISLIEPGMEVKVLTATNLTTRGTLKLYVDKAGGKSGDQVYYYNRSSSQGVLLYSLSGKKMKSTSGHDFISTDMLKPKCSTSKCVGEVVVPSEAKTYIKIKTPGNKAGWVFFESLEPGC
jgi:hypothetical protein